MQAIPSLPSQNPTEAGSGQRQPGTAAIRRAAEAFEAAFLAEMLSHAGIGKPPEGFGGGAGEDGFASFLIQAYAEKIAATGHFGIAEAIVRASTDGSADHG